MKRPTHVSFIGAGEIGSALARLVSHSGAHVQQWDADPKKVPGQALLEKVVCEADVLFFCIPSWVLATAMKPALPHLSKKTLCVFVSKGIEQKSGLFMDAFIKKLLPKNQPFVLMSGPMLAEELSEGKGGAACIATKSKKDFEKMADIFSCGDLALFHAPDQKSVAIVGVLKNVYAIALGIADGLDWGDNRKGWLCGEVIQEMIIILRALKADPSYALSQAGIGDFIATGMSKYSSNQTMGRALAEGGYCERKSEGCESLLNLSKKLGKKRIKELPVLEALLEVIEHGKKTKDIFEELFCA